MKKTILALALVAGFIAFTSRTNAQTSPLTWNFSAVGSDYSLSGTITGVSNGDGSYKAVSGNAIFGSGYFAGITATLMSIPTADSVYVWGPNWWTGDKLLPSTTLLDGWGINFDFQDSGKDTWFSIWSSPPNYYAEVKYNDGTAFGAPNINSRLNPNITLDGETSSFTLTQAVPEPSTYALFGLGALALVVAYRRKVA